MSLKTFFSKLTITTPESSNSKQKRGIEETIHNDSRGNVVLKKNDRVMVTGIPELSSKGKYKGLVGNIKYFTTNDEAGVTFDAFPQKIVNIPKIIIHKLKPDSIYGK